MYMKCGRCKGSKSVIGLGCIKKTCHVCDGVGYVKQVEGLKENGKKRRSKAEKGAAQAGNN